MANILYRGSAVPTATNAAGVNNAPLTNDQIDKNLYALDLAKFEKSGGTISGDTTFSTNVTVSGNLTVSGTTTTINTTNLQVTDANIEIGKVASPSDATANGGGITLLGQTNKTITWDSTNLNWTSSEHWNIVTGKSYKINNAIVLSSDTLGAGVTKSSLTKLGTAAGFVKSDSSGNLTVDTNTYLTVVSTGNINDGNVTTIKIADANVTTAKLADGNVTSAKLADSGVTTGTYNNVTVSTKGIVTGGSNTAYLTAESDTLATVTGRGASTTVASTFSGGLTATGITVSKSGTDSVITFPAQTNDPGYIKHYESNNTAIMYFNASDDNNDFFYFGYTSAPDTFKLRTDGVVTAGTWQGSSISTSYTDAKVTSVSGTAPISVSPTTGAAIVSHNTSGVTQGTYNNVTVNTYGHVTAGSNVAYLTSYTESDTLATVTGRGASTSTASTFTGGLLLGGSSATQGATLTLKSGTGNAVSTGSWSTISTGEGKASPVTGYAAGFTSGGIFIEANHGDVGGIYVGSDQCTIWNAADSGYLFRIVEEDDWQLLNAFPAQGTTLDPGYSVSSTGPVKFVIDGSGNVATAGSITSNGSITASGNVTAYSDVRLKTNIKTIENALDTTLKLRGVTFQKDGKDSIGVIAQEVQEVLPELVLEGNDEQKTLSVAYGNIVGVLIEAIKELNSKVEDLQNQLANK